MKYTPGIELDALIAEKVFDKSEDSYTLKDGYEFGIPNYSTNISAAWEVVEAIKSIRLKDSKEAEFFIEAITLGTDKGKYIAGFQYDSWYDETTFRPILEFGESAPHAICLAALKAVGHDIS